MLNPLGKAFSFNYIYYERPLLGGETIEYLIYDTNTGDVSFKESVRSEIYGQCLFNIIDSLSSAKFIEDTVCLGSVSDVLFKDINNFIQNKNDDIIISFQEYNNLMFVKHFLDICYEDSRFFRWNELLILTSALSIPLPTVAPFIKGVKKLDKNNSKQDLKDILIMYNEPKFSRRYVTYQVEQTSLMDICLLSISSITNGKCIEIKKCNNCGKYFIPYNRSDTIYCNRISPQDSSKMCKEYGAEQAYKEKLKSDTASGLYRAIYMQKQMLQRRNPDILEYKIDFEKYKILSKEWNNKVKKGIKSKDEFIDWLESMKSNKS